MAHLSDGQINTYLRYLLGIQLDKIDPQELTEIEAHIYDCESCFNQVQKEYEKLKLIENWDIDMDNQAILRSRSEDDLQSFFTVDTNLEAVSIDDNNTSTNFVFDFMIYLNSYTLGDREISRIEISNPASSFQYTSDNGNTRNNKSQAKIRSYKQVILKQDNLECEVILGDDRNSLTVNIFPEKYDTLPRIILKQINFLNEAFKTYQSQEAVYFPENNCFQYFFTHIEKGVYKLSF